MHTVAHDGKYEVWCQRFDGSSRLYDRFESRATAESVARLLREISLPCEVRGHSINRTGGSPDEPVTARNNDT